MPFQLFLGNGHILIKFSSDTMNESTLTIQIMFCTFVITDGSDRRKDTASYRDARRHQKSCSVVSLKRLPFRFKLKNQSSENECQHISVLLLTGIILAVMQHSKKPGSQSTIELLSWHTNKPVLDSPSVRAIQRAFEPAPIQEKMFRENGVT